jgi:hypothetical protein
VRPLALENPLSVPQQSSAQEFRRYRRLVSWVALVIIFVGSGHLLVSVGVTIYRQRHAVPTGTPISAAMTREELRGCWQELVDVSLALQKHLEKSHYLLSGYDQQETQRWADEGAIWRNRWKALGERCRLGQPGRAGRPRQLEALSAAYLELAETEAIYTRELLRFGREQAPRLDRVRERIRRIGVQLDRMQARTGETP